MKKIIYSLSLVVSAGLLLTACQKKSSPSAQEEPKRPELAIISTTSSITPSNSSRFVPVDSVNKMILSYLNSINYQSDTENLRSIIYSADTLRKYLSDTSIKKVKIMLAHSLDYINGGGKNINCGYDAGALTIIFAGYNSLGNYVTPSGMVPDRGLPCPHNCPSSGAAAYDLIQ